MTSDPFDSLFGGDSQRTHQPMRNRGGRPTREQAEAKLRERASLASAAAGKALDDVGGVQVLRRPVTINTLATVFNHDVQTVTKRLIDCPFVKQGHRKLYDFAEACSYIVKPRMTDEQLIKTLNTANLPPAINKALWDAQRSRVKYMIEAQEAWETEEVLETFGTVFITLNDHLRMAEEEMRERAKLTDDQARLFAEYMDELRSELREKLIELPKQRQTTSLKDKPLFGTSIAPSSLNVDEEDDA